MFSHRIRNTAGFTLIELVVVIVIVGILAGVLFTVIRGPIEASLDVQQRANIVARAETALQRMVREVRLALPNSVRVSGNNAVEFLRTVDGGRYRDRPPPGNRRLRFNNSAAASGIFEVLGGLMNIEQTSATLDTDMTAGSEAACLNGSTDCMVVYNTGQSGANAYAGDNVAAIRNYDAANDALSYVRSSAFPFESPQQRFQIVDTPVSYICSGGNITRYSGYPIQTTQPLPPTAGSSNLLVDNVTACGFSYDPGTSSRAGLLIFSLTISQGGQNVTLTQQAHVENLP